MKNKHKNDESRDHQYIFRVYSLSKSEKLSANIKLAVL